MKNKIKKVLLFILILTLFIAISGDCFAAPINIKTNFSGEKNPEGSNTVRTLISTVLSIVRTIGIGVAVIILMVIACKYMLASASERAEIKKYAVNYIVGAVVLFASSALISIINDIVNKNMNG